MFGREISEYDVVTNRLSDQIKDKHDKVRDKELETFYDKRRKKQKAIQEQCSHVVTFKDEFEDMHKGVVEIIVYCKACGKTLERH